MFIPLEVAYNKDVLACQFFYHFLIKKCIEQSGMKICLFFTFFSFHITDACDSSDLEGCQEITDTKKNIVQIASS